MRNFAALGALRAIVDPDRAAAVLLGAEQAMHELTALKLEELPVTRHLERLRDLSAKMLVSELLGGATDPEGDPIDFGSVATVSENGGQIFVANGWILYHPLSGSNTPDSFTYTLRDSFGAESTGTVNIVIRGPGDAPTLNVRSIENLPGTGGHVRVRVADQLAHLAVAGLLRLAPGESARVGVVLEPPVGVGHAVSVQVLDEVELLVDRGHAAADHRHFAVIRIVVQVVMGSAPVRPPDDHMVIVLPERVGDLPAVLLVVEGAGVEGEDRVLLVEGVLAEHGDALRARLDHVVTGLRLAAQARGGHRPRVHHEQVLEPPRVGNVLVARQHQVGVGALEALERVAGVVDVEAEPVRHAMREVARPLRALRRRAVRVALGRPRAKTLLGELFGEKHFTPAADFFGQAAFTYSIRDNGTSSAVAVIARQVHLSPGTVRNHLSSAIGKTGASNRIEAANTAVA